MCGCLGSNRKSTVSSSNRVTNSSTSSNTSSVSIVTGCRSRYNELAGLNIKVIELLKKDTLDTIYKEANTQLRIWIRNLGVECPPSEDYEPLREYIENEYTINFS